MRPCSARSTSVSNRYADEPSDPVVRIRSVPALAARVASAHAGGQKVAAGDGTAADGAAGDGAGEGLAARTSAPSANVDPTTEMSRKMASQIRVAHISRWYGHWRIRLGERHPGDVRAAPRVTRSSTCSRLGARPVVANQAG